jgi:universal stress protein A
MPSQTKSEPFTVKNILVPTDFSEASNIAFKYALCFGQQFGAELHIIHVLGPTISPQFPGVPEAPALSEEELASVEKKLKVWSDSAGAMGLSAKLILRNGLAAHEIVQAAKGMDADLVIIATHGHSGLRHLVIGSTAERVVRAAPCPVLVVREKQHGFI